MRWDYAFFQMAVETNFLTYRKGNGRWGDVNPKQNNFAGLGTTGGGVPGDSYPDVDTGVLAQIQHLVVYSGERIDDPVGAAHQAEAGRHHRDDGEQEGPHHVRRPVAPLGRRSPLRCIHRMGGEQLPAIVLQRSRSRRGRGSRCAQAGETRGCGAASGTAGQSRRSCRCGS